MKIERKLTKKSKLGSLDFNNIQFGNIFTDHMFTADFRDGEWTNLQILPFGNIEISPAMVSLHYGQEVFEGMKAYKRDNDAIVLLRPQENAERINKSLERLAMPTIPEELFMDGLKELLRLDKDWIPPISKGSLYIRPFVFASEAFLGMRIANEYKFIIIMTPAGIYYEKPLNVKIEDKFSRACPGGTGFAKVAGNYAGSLLPTILAKQEGFDQIIWTDSSSHKFIEEAGTMNLFFVIENKLVTPAISETILKGITRDSILKLAEDLGIKSEERKVLVEEIIEGIENGKVTEIFGAGTAVNVTNISLISFKNNKYKINSDNPVSSKLKQYLEDIRSGAVEDKFNWVSIL